MTPVYFYLEHLIWIAWGCAILCGIALYYNAKKIKYSRFRGTITVVVHNRPKNPTLAIRVQSLCPDCHPLQTKEGHIPNMPGGRDANYR
jgi:hypothetical protein